MMTFRKLSAAGSGKLLRAYFTENSPEPARDPATTPGRHLDPGGRLTAYYTGRDSRVVCHAVPDRLHGGLAVRQHESVDL